MHAVTNEPSRDSLLKRVVWSALTSRHAQFSQGGDLARRFDPAISPFAAAANNSPEALAALAELIDMGFSLSRAQAALARGKGLAEAVYIYGCFKGWLRVG